MDNLTLDSRAREQAMQGFMTQVFGWMTIGLLLTAFTAWYAAPAEFSRYAVANSLTGKIASNPIFFWGLIIAELGLVFIISGMIEKMNSATATGLFMLYSVLNGLTLSVVLVAYTSESVASTFFITAFTFGAMAAYGYTTKKDLTSWGSLLFMGLIGIIVATIVNIFLKSSALGMIIAYVGVLVFVGLTAYDTQKLKYYGEQLSADDSEGFKKASILGALTLYLDFINLFLMLLRILGDRR